MKGFLIFLLILCGILAVLFINRGIRLRRRKIRSAKIAAQKSAQAIPPQPEEPPVSLADSQELRYLRNVLGCYVPDTCPIPSAPLTESLELTETEAVAQGYSFRKKSTVVHITNYHGKAEKLTIPCRIGDRRVSKIGSGAFAKNASLRHVKIPASVHSIGKEVFAGSALETCILPDGLEKIPAYAFEGCKRLHTIHLPAALTTIGEKAFAGCEALHQVTFPLRCEHFGDHAFVHSGLSGFSLAVSRKPNAGAGITWLTGSQCISHAYVNNGAAFCHTPLHKNYQFVLASPASHSLRILLCGSQAKPNMQFSAQRNVQFGRGSLEFTNVNILDLSRCPRVEIHPEAFFPVIYRRRRMKVIVPKNCSELHFPPEVAVTYADGSVCENRALHGTWDTASTVRTNAANILAYGIHGKTPALEIIPEREGDLMCCGRYAFVTPYLVTLKAPLSRNSAEIFSKRCGSLREVQFPENGEIITKYIPDRHLIGMLHRELLPAFRGDGAHFFDRSVYDRAFLRGTYIWHDGTTRPLSQKQRLMMCFDVLRSTQRAHEEKPYIYIAYLLGHLRYARKLCKKIEPTHPEYLRWLVGLDFSELYRAYPEAKQYLMERAK